MPRIPAVKKNIYTYVVDHKDKLPIISASTKVNDGKLVGVLFDDAFVKLEKFEDFLNKLRNETACDQTKYAIDDFLN